MRGEGGGVIIAVKNTIVSCSVHFDDPPECKDEEQVWCSVSLDDSHCTLYLGCFYRAPDSNVDSIWNLYDTIAQLYSSTNNSTPRKLLICGDFNCKNINWDTEEDVPTLTASSRVSSCLLDLIHTFDLKQFVRKATRVTSTSSSILDLVLTNMHDGIVDIHTIPGLSDHRSVVGTLTLPLKQKSTQRRVLHQFLKTDWESFKSYVQSHLHLDSVIPVDEEYNVDSEWLNIKNVLLTAISLFVPSRRVPICNRSPWLNTSAKRLLRKQRRLHSKAKKSGSDQDISCFKQVRQEATTLCKTLYNNFINRALASPHSKAFWKFVKSKRVETLSPPLRAGNELITDSVSKANLFNSYFQSVFTTSTPNSTLLSSASSYVPMSPISFTSKQIYCSLLKLEPGKAAGPDEIPPIVIKNLSTELTPALTVLFQQILITGVYPTDWKRANIVPIHKAGSRNDVSNYRPVSLTSVISKVFERLLSSAIHSHLSANGILNKNQHGFRSGYSTDTQATLLYHDLSLNMDQRREMDMVFLDFSKAFDKVSHYYLIAKLQSMAIHPQVISVVQSFLANRTQQVLLDGHSSGSVLVTSGVPQGTVLGPLLFLIYINDLCNSVASSVRLYADDCVIYRVISNASDTLTLQEDLNTISSWCLKWDMQLNLDKCVYMNVSRLRTNCFERTYKLGNHTLKKVNKFKYLGVFITSNLKWNDHIQFADQKANQMLGFIRRHFYNCDQQLKRKCYMSLVRPHMEYASCVWDPHHITLSAKLESTQNRSIRFICNNYSRLNSVTDMRNSLNIPLLSERRRYLRLCLFYKFNVGLVSCSPPDLHRKVHQRRNDNGHAYVHYLARSEPFFSSFFPKTVREWNSLPRDIVAAPSLASFKHMLCEL
jgi:hypothetical protein